MTATVMYWMLSINFCVPSQEQNFQQLMFWSALTCRTLMLFCVGLFLFSDFDGVAELMLSSPSKAEAGKGERSGTEDGDEKVRSL